MPLFQRKQESQRFQCVLDSRLRGPCTVLVQGGTDGELKFPAYYWIFDPLIWK